MSYSQPNLLMIESDPRVDSDLAAVIDGIPSFDVELHRCSSINQAYDMAKYQRYAVVFMHIADERALARLQSWVEKLDPLHIIAIVPTELEPKVLPMLRAGVWDVYSERSLQQDAKLISRSIGKHIQRFRAYNLSEVMLKQRLDELQLDQKAALEVQKNILPEQPQVIDGVLFDYSLTPSLMMSGDYVEIAPISMQYTLFYLADVSGHGTASALVTVLLKNMTSRLLRNYYRQSSFDILSPVETLQRINQEFLVMGLGKHATIFVGLIDHINNTLTYAVGGHHPMPIYKHQDKAHYLPGKGMPVGLFEEAEFEQQQLQLDESFSLALFSDGVLEVLPGETMQEQQDYLLEWIEGNFVDHQSLQQLILSDRDSCPDDIAILTVSRM